MREVATRTWAGKLFQTLGAVEIEYHNIEQYYRAWLWLHAKTLNSCKLFWCWWRHDTCLNLNVNTVGKWRIALSHFHSPFQWSCYSFHVYSNFAPRSAYETPFHNSTACRWQSFFYLNDCHRRDVAMYSLVALIALTKCHQTQVFTYVMLRTAIYLT